jgi:DNA-binding NarL/FixJ family response regulator
MELVKPKKIFIVEEDDLFVNKLKSYLIEKASHEVHSFGNCADCLAGMTDKPDIVVLDNHLNNTQKDKATDMHLLDIIRRDYPDVHVIVLAKDEGYGTAMQTILHGAEQYIIKDEKTVEAIHNMVGEL